MDIIFADRVIPLASLCVRTRVRRNNMTTSVWMIERIDFEWRRGRGGGGGEKNVYGM